MPKLAIDLIVPGGLKLHEEKQKRLIVQQNLSNEWNIVCVYSLREPCKWIIYSIDLYRKNTSEKISVSGEVEIVVNCDTATTLSCREVFSLSIKKGSAFTTVCPYHLYIGHTLEERIGLTTCRLQGFVNILDDNEKQLPGLTIGESKEIIQMKSFEHVAKDLEKILDPQLICHSDVILKCGSTRVPAHKFILSARSPVFAAMFAHPTKESQKNEVDITDIDVFVIQAMLKFMYTGNVADLTVSLASDLLFVADKYQLQDLKVVCSHYLKETVCTENVWKILVLGDMHDQNLKSFAVDYIRLKCGEFSVLQEWKDLRKERPDLAMDLLEILVKSRDGKN